MNILSYDLQIIKKVFFNYLDSMQFKVMVWVSMFFNHLNCSIEINLRTSSELSDMQYLFKHFIFFLVYYQN